MKNLLTYFQHEYEEEILLYFTAIVKEEVQEDKQDRENKWIICVTDEYLKEKNFDDIGLWEVQSFMDTQKKKIEEASLGTIKQPEAIDMEE